MSEDMQQIACKFFQQCFDNFEAKGFIGLSICCICWLVYPYKHQFHPTSRTLSKYDMIELKSARYIKCHSTQPISITDATHPTVNTNLIIYVTTQFQRQLLKVIWWCNISLSYTVKMIMIILIFVYYKTFFSPYTGTFVRFGLQIIISVIYYLFRVCCLKLGNPYQFWLKRKRGGKCGAIN